MKRVNAVVVGVGAAGSIVAKELATVGLSVVLLERGKWYTASDHRKDELCNQHVTVLDNAFGPDDDGNPRVSVYANARRTFLPSDGPMEITSPRWPQREYARFVPDLPPEGVETVDTSYANAPSGPNIHWIKCTDFHQHSIPKAKQAANVAKQQATSLYGLLTKATIGRTATPSNH